MTASREFWRRCGRNAQIIGLGACVIGLAGACASDDESEAADAATEFWEALVAGDSDAALSYVDPAFLDSSAVSPWGRATTLEDQFDWYEAVGWQWTLEDPCVEVETNQVECAATATSAWIEALDVEPITGTFLVRFSDDGILAVNDRAGSFYRQYSAPVFSVFERWVRANHPDDAAQMFNTRDPVTPEILALFTVNTERFSEAQQ